MVILLGWWMRCDGFFLTTGEVFFLLRICYFNKLGVLLGLIGKLCRNNCALKY